jgi:hypothetical protein
MIQYEKDAQKKLTQQTVVTGIEATPAIDPRLGRIYVSYRRRINGDLPDGTQRLAALDIRSGAVLKDIAVSQDALWNSIARSRASLLIDNGLVFIGFAPRCEGIADHSYHGWVYAFDSSTLTFRGRYETTKSSDIAAARDHGNDLVAGGGIWQASTGIAADAKGSLYFATGNADEERKSGIMAPPDASGNNLSNSIVRLKVNYDLTTAAMAPADWFTPYRKVWQDNIDLDFGSAGVVLIPNTRYLVGGGKEGILYVLDRDNLGKFDERGGQFDSSFYRNNFVCKDKTWADPEGRDDPNRDRVIQKIYAGINQYCDHFHTRAFCFDLLKHDDELCPERDETPHPAQAANGVSVESWIAFPHVHGTPVFGAFSDNRARLYVWPEKDHLKSYAWRGASVDPKPTIATALPDHKRAVLSPPYYLNYLKDGGTIGAIGMPGPILSLTIDPSSPSSGILFASVQRCTQKGDRSPSFNECSFFHCSVITHCNEQHFGMLRAFDPITLKELWNNQNDSFASGAQKTYWYSKWVPPTIAKGRVYLATQSDQVLVYGRH